LFVGYKRSLYLQIFCNYKVIGVHQGTTINDLKIGRLIKSIVDVFNKTYNINKSKLNLKEGEKEKE